MKDIIHEPRATDESQTKWVCGMCSEDIPQPVAVLADGMGLKVVEIAAGAGYAPYDNTPGAISCSSPMAERERSQASTVDFSDVDLELTPGSLPGDSVKPARPVSDFERQVSQMSMRNFVEMRELTRPSE